VINDELLALLRCPETGQCLSPASLDCLATLEAARTAGQLRNRAGQPVSEPITAGLVREDHRLFFPIHDGFPILLLDEAVPLAEL
jgi:uncharacterized protein YbaR (Trm112 family)